MRNAEWILCPVCGNKTRNRISNVYQYIAYQGLAGSQLRGQEVKISETAAIQYSVIYASKP